MRSTIVTVACLGMTLALGPIVIGLGQGKNSETDAKKLINQLTDRDEKVRDAAARTLEKNGISVIDDLLIAFEKGRAEIRSEVGRILGNIRHAALSSKDKDVANAIEDILVNSLRDPDYRIVCVVSSALTDKEPRSKKAIPVLISMLQREDSIHALRSAAVIGLKNNGPEAAAAIPVLLKIVAQKRVEKTPKIESGQDFGDVVNKSKAYLPGERGTICMALAAIGPKDDRVAALLLRTLRDRSEDALTRSNAATGLAMTSSGQLALTDIVDFLKETAKDKQKFSGERESITRALGALRLGKNEIVYVIEAATDPKEIPSGATRAAIECLANNALVSGDGWMPLMKLMHEGSHNPRIRPLYFTILVALEKIDPPANESKEILAAQVKAFVDNEGLLSKEQLPELRTAAEMLLKKLKKP